MSVSLNHVAQRLLPRLHERFSASDIVRRLVRGSAWSLFGSALSRVLMLIGMIVLARMLGQTQFGEFGMIQATLGVAGIMAGFGLGSTATRFVAQHSRTDPARAGRIIALVARFSWTLILIVTLGITLGADTIAHIILRAGHLETSLVLGALLLVATAIRGVQSGVLAGVERFDVIAKLNVLEGIASFLCMVTFAWLFGLEGGLIGLAAGTATAWIVGHAALQKTLVTMGIVVTVKGAWKERGILIGYSLPSFLASSVAIPILWYCMTLVSGRSNGYDDLALYNAAYQWHGPLIFLPMVLLSVSSPVLVQQWEHGSLEKFRKVFLWNAGVAFTLTSLPVVLIAMLSPWIMSLYGPGFRNSWMLLVLLAAAAPLHAVAKTAATALLGMNRAWSVAALNILWGIAMLLIASILTPPFGALGLSLAFFSAYFILMALTTVTLFWYLRGGAARLANRPGGAALAHPPIG